ncbi:MAG: HAD-IC family P-type ATPase, partial [Planctomycetes bacterium]|nr:HAD-IC family P-type ATPase [Planctomycetota bacterium]
RAGGIEVVRAETRPEEKAREDRALREAGRVVMMVGDCVNDAPSLAAADVGVVIGAGADVAVEAASVTRVGGDLAGVVAAWEISRRALAVIRQNLVWAFGYNVAAIPVAAGALLPWGVTLTPSMAAAAMACSSISVVLNSLRLRSAGVRL